MIDNKIWRTLKYTRPKFVFGIKKPVDSCLYSLAQQQERNDNEAIRVLDEALCPNRSK